MNITNPAKYVVDFGKGKSGLSSIGFVLKDFNRTIEGIVELIPGSGIYGITIEGIITPSYILWDTGDSSKLYGIEDINIPLSDIIFQSVNFGPVHSGLNNVGATIAGVRTVALELAPGSGIYGGTFTPPRGFRGSVFWDSGETDPVYAVREINLQYSLAYFFQTSSFIMKKVTDAVNMIELQGAVGEVGEVEAGHLLVSDGGYLLLSTEGRITLRQPS